MGVNQIYQNCWLQVYCKIITNHKMKPMASRDRREPVDGKRPIDEWKRAKAVWCERKCCVSLDLQMSFPISCLAKLDYRCK